MTIEQNEHLINLLNDCSRHIRWFKVLSDSDIEKQEAEKTLGEIDEQLNQLWSQQNAGKSNE